jgi:metal-responsive CopG/Arc/MetJ family transcriptional regulator
LRQTITISLPEEIKQEIDRIVKEEGVSRSDVIRESLRDYLFVRRFRALRSRMVSRARSRKIFTDDDVFERIS